MLIGVGTRSLKVKELAERIGRNPSTASWLYSEAAARRRDDAVFRVLAKRTVATLAASPQTAPTEMEAGVNQR